MTAEVVVMNKTAIALAADSKVTVGGTRAGKTYDTVNKLFTLSKYHPVGVMIYGNAEFMDYPWETVIKLYRKEKGQASHSTIAEWAQDFQGFVQKFGSIEPKHKETNLKRVCGSWFSEVLEEAEQVAIARDLALGSDEHISILKDVFQAKTFQVISKEEWLTGAKARTFIKNFGKSVDEITKEYVGPYKNDDLSSVADQFISAAILFKHPSPRSSGVVIAGFGDDEYFPTVVSLEIDGYIGNGIKMYEEGCIDISRELSGCLRAFAQREMVQRFMSGIDSELYDVLMASFLDTLASSCIAVVDKYGTARNKTNKVRQAVAKAAQASVQKLSEEIVNITTRNYSDPIVRMLSLLPKDELANLAESLVALTSLKRRVSSDAETVGGAIDVALISKGDGFVWIKRKYYFPEDLNPHFNRTYLQHLSGGQNERAQ